MDFSKFKYAYALSGGIGSGKSSVCQILSSMGYEIIDADKIAHGLLEKKKQEIVGEFGLTILSEGKISRAKLGRIVFDEPAKLQKLNQILSFDIQREIYKQCLELEEKKNPFFVEIALLFELRESYNFKQTILIFCSKEEQIKRVCQRNGLSLDEVEKRIDSQISLEKKLPLAWSVIENNGSEDELKQKIRQWLRDKNLF